MSRDVLLYGLSSTPDAARLLHWAQHTPGLHDFPAPDFHRLQIEHWLWSHREELAGKDVIDIGVYVPRRYFGDGYKTLGEHDEDITGDVLALPLEEGSVDAVILTEVLEHCTDPVRAVSECYRVLKPLGLLLVTSPYLWPEHGIKGEYRDYWRFTRHGWELLLRAFTDVSIVPCGMTDEGAAAYDLMRRFECMGFASETQITTGYLCIGRKA